MQNDEECTELNGICVRCNLLNFECECDDEILYKLAEYGEKEKNENEMVTEENESITDNEKKCSCELCNSIRENMKDTERKLPSMKSENDSDIFQSDGEDEITYVKLDKDARHIPNENTYDSSRFMEKIIFRYPPSNQNLADKQIYSLKCSEKSFLNAGETKYVPSNIEIKYNQYQSRISRRLEIQSDISNGWLNDSFSNMISIKNGTIHPNFYGVVHVKMYNKTNHQVIIPIDAPIGKLVSTRFDYTNYV